MWSTSKDVSRTDCTSIQEYNGEGDISEEAISKTHKIKGTDLFFVPSNIGILLKLSLMSTIHSNK